MRTLMLMATLILIPSAGASAQALDPASSCWSLATKGEVVVTKTDGTSVKDTVLCIGRDQVMLAKAGSMKNAKRQSWRRTPPSFAFCITA